MPRIRLILIAVILNFTFSSPFVLADTQSVSINRQTLIKLTNTERNKNSLPSLKESFVLNEAAKLKAKDMASKNYFAHNSPEGKTPWYWFGLAGYNFANAGENLAIRYSDSRSIVSAWMNSASHKANILDNKFTEIGIAVVTGTYNGVKTSYVVEVFGSPIKKVVARKTAKVLSYNK